MELHPVTTTVKTPAENFTGDVYLNPIFNGDGTSFLLIALVRFTPARGPIGTPTPTGSCCIAPTASGSSLSGTAPSFACGPATRFGPRPTRSTGTAAPQTT